MILRVKDASLGKMLAECGMDSRMLAVLQAFLTQESLGSVEHCVVRPASGKFRVARPQQRFSCSHARSAFASNLPASSVTPSLSPLSDSQRSESCHLATALPRKKSD